MSDAGQIILPSGDVPGTPSSGKVTVYSKTDKFLYYKGDDGIERQVTASGTSGATTLLELTDTPAAYDTGKYLKSTASGTEWGTATGDHSALSQLDYASAGHTGFASAADLTNVSGTADTNTTNIAVNTALIATTSGTLQTEIDNMTTTHSGLTDMPSAVNTDHDGRYYTETEVDTISGSLNTKIDNLTAADIIFEGTETVEEILDDTLNGGVLDAITVTTPSGLTVNWTAGEIWDHTNKAVVNTLSGTGTATDNAVNYLIWTTGTSLSLGIVHADAHADEVEVADFAVQTGTIHATHNEEILSMRGSTMSAALEDIVEVIVISGLIVSENADATYGLDVESSVGVYYQDGHNKIEVPAMTSSGTLMMRDFKTAGAWDMDMNAEIDTAYYNNGTNLVAAGTKWYKSFFIIAPDHMHWVYPTVQYNNEAAALAAPLPAKPPGLAKFPNSVSLVYQGGSSSLPAAGTDNWADIRPIIGATGSSSPISDHGNLTGLADDDHTQYALLGGRSGGQVIKGGSANNENLSFWTNSTGVVGTYYLTDLFTDGFVKTTGTTGALAVDTTEYLPTAASGVLQAGIDTNTSNLSTLQSDFTSHSGTLSIHRELDDTISGTENLWSASKIVEFYDSGGSGEVGKYTLASGVTTGTIGFVGTFDDTTYNTNATLTNTVDAIVSLYGVIITATTVSGFEFELTGETDSGNYVLNWQCMDTVGNVRGLTTLNATPNDQTGSGDIANMQVDANTAGFAGALHMDTDGNWIDACASGTGTMPCSALALEGGTGMINVLMRGFITNTSWDWTPGATIYVSTIPGVLEETAPSGTGEYVQIAGMATHADRMWFMPTYNLVKVD